MKILILAAGYGTRLYPLVKDTPKAFLDIQDKPLIAHVIDKIKIAPDLNEFLVVTNNKFFKAFDEWAKRQAFNVRVINDGTETPEQRLGSIGDIQFVLKQHPFSDDLLVVGSDNLFNFNLEDFFKFAQKDKNAATIGLYDIQDISHAHQFGVVSIDKNKKIILFEEKPLHPKSTLIAMCFYYFPKSTLPFIAQYIKEEGKADRAGDYIKWVAEKHGAYGFTFSGKWYDIGSIEAYHDAQKNFI
ncbi:MAG TPA: nucleotidyltransferase family protein [Candidatus Omnitrophota bacterium]|nr:nucleotidyltransferase family protein [Candidatus Omnitrophota bacterium]